MQGRVTQPFNKDTAYNGKIGEFQRERNSERPRQLTYRESHLGQIPRAKKKPVEKKKISLLRERYCECSGSKEPPCAKGLPHLLGLSRMPSFSLVWVQRTSCFLHPRAGSPFCTEQRAMKLGSSSGSSLGTGTKLLSKYRTQL